MRLKTSADNRHLDRVVLQVEQKLKEAKHPSRSPTETALLAALNIADELLQLKSDAANFKAQILNQTDVVLGYLEQVQADERKG